MKKIVFAILPIFLIGCNSRNVSKLDQEIMEYSSLPEQVKKTIFDETFIDLNTPTKYYTKSRQERFFPWIYHIDIHRKSDEKIFETELSGEYGNRYIIYNDYLFIPNHYNIYKADSSEYTFTRFRLE